jgi:hypothetical protein
MRPTRQTDIGKIVCITKEMLFKAIAVRRKPGLA